MKFRKPEIIKLVAEDMMCAVHNIDIDYPKYKLIYIHYDSNS